MLHEYSTHEITYRDSLYPVVVEEHVIGLAVKFLIFLFEEFSFG